MGVGGDEGGEGVSGGLVGMGFDYLSRESQYGRITSILHTSILNYRVRSVHVSISCPLLPGNTLLEPVHPR